MNKNQLILFQAIVKNPAATQRQLAVITHFSLGKVNKTFKKLVDGQWLDERHQLSHKANQLIDKAHPQKAVILAAGFGMRMVPINTEQPKALLEVHHHILVERIIQQLHEVGIHDITIVVGFMKEHFEYLIDQEHVKLVTNTKYATSNNLYSLSLAVDQLNQCYIIPGDIWFKDNPFNKVEFYPWYLFSDQKIVGQSWAVNKQGKIKNITQGEMANKAVGLAYFNSSAGDLLQQRIASTVNLSKYNQSFWENVLDSSILGQLIGKIIPETDYQEINTYEDLLNADENSNHLNNKAIDIITKVLNVGRKEIVNISVLKKGMTNRSFICQVHGSKYIMRIPGNGTKKLINRQHEAAVYKVLAKFHISDPVLYLNPQNGYKLTKFMPNSRNCDPQNIVDVQKCMSFLRKIHQLNLQVGHSFDLFEQINFYEQLRAGHSSCYRDYLTVKKRVFQLQDYISKHIDHWCLTHIDANPDNFLISNDNGKESLRLIDWEYAGMQDPHLDIATFASYAMYDRQHVDSLIDCYFNHRCSQPTRIKIYCYLAAVGLLWSNWCEYKQQLGIEFGEYSLAQFRFAKEYSRLAINYLKEN